MSETVFELVEGGGNVFRDLGDPDVGLKRAKAIIAARIVSELDDRGLAVKAGTRTGFAAADSSRIRNADLGRFTLDGLMKMLSALDRSVRISMQVERRQEFETTAAVRGRHPGNARRVMLNGGPASGLASEAIGQARGFVPSAVTHLDRQDRAANLTSDSRGSGRVPRP